MKPSIGMLVVASVMSLGCGEATPVEMTERSYQLITHGDPANPFWDPIRLGMDDAAADRGVAADFFGAVDPNIPAPEQQATQIRAAIAADVDGIAVTVSDAAVLEAPLREAAEAGLHIVAFNVPASPEDMELYDLPISTYVGQIETVVGGTAGVHGVELVEAAGGTVDVALCLKGMNDAAWAVQRCQGFTDALAPLGVTVVTLGGDFYADPPSVPTQTFIDWFEMNPEVDLVFSTAPAPLALVLSMRADGVVASDVTIGSVDLDAATLDAIRTGSCAFAVDQQPYMQGYLSVTLLDLETLYLLRPSQNAATGPFFVDQSNVEEIAGLIASGYR